MHERRRQPALMQVSFGQSIAGKTRRPRGDARYFPMYYDAKTGKLFLEVSCWNSDFLKRSVSIAPDRRIAYRSLRASDQKVLPVAPEHRTVRERHSFIALPDRPFQPRRGDVTLTL